MPSCLGIHVQNNLIKYAKIFKNQNSLKIEAYGVKFYDSDIEKTIEQIVRETSSYQIPISINIDNEKFKDIMDTPVSENITTDIFKVNALVTKQVSPGFVNYYFNDIDGYTGSYTYTANNGSDFEWLDKFDGKICTVYLSPINCKSTASDCFYRFIPISVEDEGYTFNEENAPKFGLTYYACEQFSPIYNADPSQEMLASVNSELLGLGDITFTYASANTDVVYFETIEGKTYMHTVNEADAVVDVTITANYKNYTASETVTINVGEEINVDSVSVIEAINSSEGEEIYVKGIASAYSINQSAFYITDDTGVIAIRFSNSSDFELFELGDEVIVKGKRTNYPKSDYSKVGQVCLDKAELVVNYQGDYDYSTSSFKSIEFADLYNLLGTNNAIEATAQVYTLEAKITTETQYSTNYYIGDPNGSNKIQLYSGNGGQYSFISDFVNQVVTIEVVLVDWNSKGYKAYLFAIVTEEGKIFKETYHK